MRDLSEQFSLKIPAGDDRERRVCDHCSFVDYVNPKIVVGTVASFEGRILLCKRAIEPRLGYWTLPAGYMETGESVEDGAKREAWEEARAQINLTRVMAVYSIPRISQVQIMFEGELVSSQISAGPESEAVGLYDWNDIPWDDLAFPSVHWALKAWKSTRGQSDYPVFSNPTE